MTTSIKSILRTVAVFASAAIISVTFSACNTIGGAGSDIESVGEAIEDAAD